MYTITTKIAAEHQKVLKIPCTIRNVELKIIITLNRHWLWRVYKYKISEKQIQRKTNKTFVEYGLQECAFCGM